MTLASDIYDGLSARPKRLSSRWFYDTRGSEIFQEIMGLEEYYPTRCEMEVFRQHAATMAKVFAEEGEFRLLEFGAGDGLKTRLLLDALIATGVPFSYCPIDISESALEGLTEALRQEYPSLNIIPLHHDYVSALEAINHLEQMRSVVLFLGSNIGNFTEAESLRFLFQLRGELRPGDQLMIGFDLKKDPHTILAAYNDSKGVTRAFNINLLTRLNRELGANFDLEGFEHYPTYDPLSGETRSYLVSKRRQQVDIPGCDLVVQFEAWEAIWVELSQKFDLAMIRALATRTGFRIEGTYTDSRNYFVDVIWKML
ncbi:MAG: L-histidine N(alpha)-methyltransferase [Bacteroidetes bacterium]|nr:MAG: L-histidine N(alpha)-methyltransferase [Bacteroidota bacterium]